MTQKPYLKNIIAFVNVSFEGRLDTRYLLLLTGTVYSDPDSKETLLNNFFVKNSTQDELPSGFAVPPLKNISDFKLSNIVFTPVKVFKVLKELKLIKLMGLIILAIEC